MNRFPLPAFLMVILATAGCSRTSVFDEPVRADTAMNMALWRSQVRRDLDTRDWKLFDLALQELKYRAMMDGATGAEAVEAAWRRQVHNVSLREVLRSGLTQRRFRLERDKAELENVIARNARLWAYPDDGEFAIRLDSARKNQAQRLENISREVAETEDGLRSLETRPRVDR